MVEGALDGSPLWRNQSPGERALDLFARLGVWDTAHNSGVLIYVLLADRAVEIVADRGIHACCGAERWSAVCQRMEAQFAQGRFEAGALKASWPSATCWCSTFRGARTTATSCRIGRSFFERQHPWRPTMQLQFLVPPAP